MTQLERAQNILRLVDKCQTHGDCRECEIDEVCTAAINLLDAVHSAYHLTSDEDFTTIINRTDAKWKVKK